MNKSLKKYELVYKHIEELIKKSTLEEGRKIPSIRKTAADLGVGVLTVIDGYNRLELAGLIYSRPQSGYYVQKKALWKKAKEIDVPKATVDNLSKKIEKVKQSDYVAALFEETARNDIIKLGGGVASPSFFPSKELAQHLSRVVRNKPNGVNSYSLGQGSELLRLEISKQLTRAAVSISPNELIITPGGTAGIQMALKAVCARGDTIAVESPGYFGFYTAAEFLDLSVVEVPSDPQTGLSIESFEEIAKKYPQIKALLLCSNNSNPTSATMPDDAKEKLVALARKYRIAVIEDETYAELSYSDHRSKSLKAFDADNVISLSSFNKILAPGYRVGWIAGGDYAQVLQDNFNAMYMSTPLVNQLAIASFLKEKGLLKHLRRIRKQYEINTQLFKSAVVDSFPACIKLNRARGGHFLWVEMPEGFDSEKLSDAAIKHKISIAPGIIFSAQKNHRRFFRLNCAQEWNSKSEFAISTIANLLHSI